MCIYEVKHEYDVDGGFGDAVSCSDTIAIFSTEEKAYEFVEKYSNPHVYDSPYADLSCGYLSIKEIEIDKPLTDDMWWLEDDEEEEE